MEQKDSPSTDAFYNRVKDTQGGVRPAEDNGYRFRKTTTPSTKSGRDGA
jgi:hypothetical protein